MEENQRLTAAVARTATQLRQAQQEQETANRHLAEAQARVQLLEQRPPADEAGAGEIAAALAEAQTRLDETQAELRERAADVDRLTAENQRLTTELEQETEAVAQANAQLRQAQQEQETANRHLAEAQARVQLLEQRPPAAPPGRANAGQVDAPLAEAQRRLGETQANLRQREADVARITRERDTAVTEQRRLQAALTAGEENLRRREADIAVLTEARNTSRREQEQLQTTLAECRADVTRLTAEQGRLRAQLAQRVAPRQDQPGAPPQGDRAVVADDLMAREQALVEARTALMQQMQAEVPPEDGSADIVAAAMEQVEQANHHVAALRAQELAARAAQTAAETALTLFQVQQAQAQRGRVAAQGGAGPAGAAALAVAPAADAPIDFALYADRLMTAQMGSFVRNFALYGRLNQPQKTALLGHAALAIGSAVAVLRGTLQERPRLVAERTQCMAQFTAAITEAGFHLLPAVEEGTSTPLQARVTEMATAVVDEVRKQQEHALILKYQPRLVIAELSPADYGAALALAQGKERIRRVVQQLFNDLLKRAKLPAQLKESYQIVVTSDTQGFHIRGADALNTSMGYSLFWLLLDAKVLDGNAIWDGEQTFTLTEEQIHKLQTHMKKLDAWANTYMQVMGDVLIASGDAPTDDFATLGAKSENETWSSAGKITEKGKRELGWLIGNQWCLLLAQMGLRLDLHPQRDALKAVIEWVYATEGMMAANGRPKTFVDGTYITVNSQPQLAKIMPWLHRLVRLQRALIGPTTTTSLYAACGVRELSELIRILREDYKKRIIGGLTQVVSQPLRREIEEQVERDLATTQALSALRPPVHAAAGAAPVAVARQEGQLDPTVSRMQRLLLAAQHLDDSAAKVQQAVMAQYAAPKFQQGVAPFTPTPAQITELYGSNALRAYGPVAGVFRDLTRLFTTLVNTPAVQAYQEKEPNIGNLIMQLCRALEERIAQRYNTLPEDAWPSSRKRMREAIGAFEVIVASIKYQDQSRVSPASVETALTALLSLVTDLHELQRGCDEGLEGRILSILLALTPDTVASARSHLAQKIKEALEQAATKHTNQDPYRAINSSHVPVYLGELQQYTGVSTVAAGPAARTRHDQLTGPAREIFAIFLGTFDAGTITQIAREFMMSELRLLAAEPVTVETDERMYTCLEAFGFGANRDELNERYRVKGSAEEPWQVAMLELDLLRVLPAYLASQGLIVAAPGRLIPGQARFLRDGEPAGIKSIPLPIAAPAHPQQPNRW
jgi:hypothetical protein